MTPNQRLMIAAVLSVIFFVGYTAIFPPVEPETKQSNATTQVEVANGANVSQSQVDIETGHAVSQKDKVADIASKNTILTVKNKKFILKMDTLGRISTKELLEDKFRDSEDRHAQIIPSTGAKPLYVRFR